MVNLLNGILRKMRYTFLLLSGSRFDFFKSHNEINTYTRLAAVMDPRYSF